jgi:multiple sugar transport system permease protein
MPRPGRVAYTAAKHVLLIAGAVLMTVPFIWMVLSAFKDETQVFVIPPKWIPDPFVWENFRQAWTALPFGQAYVNSLLISVVVVACTLLTSAMAAYAFARIEFRFREPLFLVFLATMMVPYQLTIIPIYLIMRELGWLDSHLSIIVPNALFNAFAVFLLRQFVRGIPREIEEAAVIDGANRLRIFWHVVLPLLKAPLAALAIFTFMAQWNNFLQPLIFLSSEDKFTVPLMINQFRGTYVTNFPVMIAAAAIATVPVLVVFVLGQRSIIRGMTLTGHNR